MTSVARTLLDLAATARPDQLERALARAERTQRYDGAAIADTIARANGHRGARRLARAIETEPAFTRSELERRFLRLVKKEGLPRPLVNVPLDALDHGHIEVDFHWPAHRLIVETDGHESHGTRAAFERDRRRDAALQAAGDRVVRFTWRSIVREEEVVRRRLRALLE